MVYEQLGLAYHRKQQYAKALQTLRKPEPMPRSQKYHEALGDTCLNLGDYQCAVQSLELGILHGATDQGTMRLLASAHKGLAGGSVAEQASGDADYERNQLRAHGEFAGHERGN